MARKKRAPKTPIPIMSPDKERFMAFEGLVQWSEGVVKQRKRLASAISWTTRKGMTPEQRRAAINARRCHEHYFAIAAWKLLEHRDWITKFGLCNGVDFTEIDSFSKRDICDLRNMREHEVGYFQGDGFFPERWEKIQPQFRSDASGTHGTFIGGRLDYEAFSDAAKRLLAQLLKEPIPFSGTGA